ncbi:hypothetical protein EH31_10345 [Erythrobacter longus]|uniref:DUF4136 domain-containing protein n=1 Tax=Erythrobacter longus TaxID=1044 RepID=A0A074MF42_ERYLO|nr:DUF4136 domain-containing protein [Erythrobacter longus]KEO90478.1 hypothetical protein EH31_10345 [Erythrobacter longus]
MDVRSLWIARRIAVPFVLASILTTASCNSSSPIDIDQDESADFSAYQSFAWSGDDPVAVTGQLPIPSETLQEIKSSIRREMQAKGYSYEREVADADLALTFSVGAGATIEQRIVTGFLAENSQQWEWGRQYFEYGEVGRSGPRVAYRAETTGELAVIAFDIYERRPVWRAAGQRVLGRDDLSGERDTIAEDVRRLMEGFPSR